MCWAESWEQRRPSEYLLRGWKKTRTPIHCVLRAWESRAYFFPFHPQTLSLSQHNFVAALSTKTITFLKNIFYLKYFFMLAFPWTINKSKDSDPVCLPSSVLPGARQAGSIAAGAVLLCQGEGGAGCQGVSRRFSRGLGPRQFHGAFLLCFLVGVWQVQVLCLSV